MMAESLRSGRQNTSHDRLVTDHRGSSLFHHTFVCTAHIPMLPAESIAGVSTWMVVTQKAHSPMPESMLVAPCSELQLFIGSTACDPLSGTMSLTEELRGHRMKSPSLSGLVEHRGKLCTWMTSGERSIVEEWLRRRS